MMLFLTDISSFLPFMIRVILGVIFLFQAHDKIFNLGLKNVTKSIMQNDKIKNLPSLYVQSSITLSSYLEFAGGALLILGLFREWAMLLLGVNLIMVTLGFSYLQGLWDMKHVFPRIILLIILFLIPTEMDTISIDELLKNFIN